MRVKHDKKKNELAKRQMRTGGNSDPEKNEGNRGSEEKSVVNLSSTNLNSDERSILKKGLKFVVAPRRIPLEEIVCAIEDAVTTLPENEADEVRQDCAVILRRATPPKHNLKKNEVAALKNLKINNKIMTQ